MIRTSRTAKSILCIAAVACVATGTVLATRPIATAPQDLAATARVAAARTADFQTARTRLSDVTTAAAESRFVSVKLRDGGGVGAPDLGGELALDLKPTFDLSKTERSALTSSLSPKASRATFQALDAWFTVEIPAGADADAFLDDLAASENVEQVFVPLEASLPVADLTVRQGYTKSSPDGIGVEFARQYAGGYGERAQIIDIEYAWDAAHEDLGRAANGLISMGTQVIPHGWDDINHGTAVLGELVGTANGFGVTGIAPKAQVGMVNAMSKEHGYNLARAIIIAASNSKPGDVILLEQQFAITQGGKDYIPVETDPTVFDAIRAATNAGIIVVEAAGNGYQDLDALGVGRSDSGAILVGAGQVEGCAGNGSSSHPRARADFSNYGSRVDVQGWGECVTTAGYGNLSADAGAHTWYTWSFSGTSSASPIVAGAAAVLSSIIESSTGHAATPSQIRSLLKSTGTPQDKAIAGHIGPMPNLAAAIKALGGGNGGDGNGGGGNGGGGNGGGSSDTTAPDITAPKAIPAVGYQVGRDYVVPTKVSWDASDASGIASYAVKVSTDGGAWTDLDLDSARATSVTLDLSANHSYRFTVNARDGAGNWGKWQSGARFKPHYYADDNQYVTYGGNWARAAWGEAEGGSVTVSGQQNAWASFSFTGRGIAWVASMGTTRGEADIWLDDEYLGRVDLSNGTSMGRVIVFAKRVSADVRHELVIGVVGTAGTPKIDLDGIVLLK